MKLLDGIVMEQVGDDYVAVATGEASEVFNGMIRSNRTANYFMSLLMEETTEEEMVQKVLEKYEIERPLAESEVHRFVEQMRKVGLLTE